MISSTTGHRKSDLHRLQVPAVATDHRQLFLYGSRLERHDGGDLDAVLERRHRRQRRAVQLDIGAAGRVRVRLQRHAAGRRLLPAAQTLVPQRLPHVHHPVQRHLLLLHHTARHQDVQLLPHQGRHLNFFYYVERGSYLHLSFISF